MIINGDCLEVMKTYPDNHFNCVVTDPPYGLHFMGKDWDKQIPSVEYWKEMLRICKPGSMMVVAGIPRLLHRVTCLIEDSGWQIRDLIMHLFGSGFPKSHNNFGFPGYGTALKPAWEGWVLAMKPLDGTYAQNAKKWGVAGINVLDSRIGIEKTFTSISGGKGFGSNFRDDNWIPPEKSSKKENIGRWPSNLILDEESAAQLDEMTGELISKWGKQGNKQPKSMLFGKHKEGITKDSERFIGDSGGASRFFYCAKASQKERNAGLEGMPINKNPDHRYGRYRCKKCDKLKLDHKPCICIEPEFERIETNQNSHPTVKPLSLMKYLITLLAPPENALCLDPFAGSGSTLVAAKELGIDCVGIELSKEYCEIAQRRVDAVKQQPEQLEFNYGP